MNNKIYQSFEGLQFLLLRKNNMRYVRIRINPPDGTVTVSAPNSVTLKEIKKILSLKYDFIIEAKKKYTYREIKFENDEKFSLWGDFYPLHIKTGIKNSCFFQNGYIEMTVKDKDYENCKKTLLNFYKSELIKKLDIIVPECEKITGIKSIGYCVKNMRSRWGSCYYTKRKLNFSLHLAKYPIICTRYVVIHELCHIIYPNHKTEFKKLLNRYFTEEKAVSCILKDKKYV